MFFYNIYILGGFFIIGGVGMFGVFMGGGMKFVSGGI